MTLIYFLFGLHVFSNKQCLNDRVVDNHLWETYHACCGAWNLAIEQANVRTIDNHEATVKLANQGGSSVNVEMYLRCGCLNVCSTGNTTIRTGFGIIISSAIEGKEEKCINRLTHPVSRQLHRREWVQIRQLTGVAGWRCQEAKRKLQRRVHYRAEGLKKPG